MHNNWLFICNFRFERELYWQYLDRAEEIYPSKWEALKDTLSRIQSSRIHLAGRFWLSLKLFVLSLTKF